MFLFAGCRADSFEEEPPLSEPVGGNVVGYIAVNLSLSDGGTRAVGDEFKYDGDEDINLSSKANHFAVFYTDGQKLPVAVSELSYITEALTDGPQANASVVIAAIAARNENKEMLEKLHDCYVILNTNLPESVMWQYTADDLLNLRVESPFFTHDGMQYFTMCNAVYLDGGQKKIDTRVDTSKIYRTYKEAIEEAWKGNAAVNAWVERLPAKFSLKFADPALNTQEAIREFVPSDNDLILFSHLSSGDIPYYKDHHDNGQKLSYRIRITGWGLNATEEESFLFRRFNPSGAYFNGWYSTGNKRVFWSEDCNYGRATYPLQYRKVIDNTGIPVYSKMAADGKNILRNYSFSDLLEANPFSQPYLYAPENTYDNKDQIFNANLDYKANLLAGTHIIVCAELLTNIENGNEWKTDDLFRDRNGSFYKNQKDCVKALVASMNNSLKTHSFLKFTYWDWDRGGVEMKLFAKTKGEYAIYYNGRKLTSQYIDEIFDANGSLTAIAEFKGSDGKRILWNDNLDILNEYGETLQIYSNIDEVDSKNDVYLRPATVNDLKSVIFEHVGAVDHFKDGKMYYAIPIGLVPDAGASSANNTAYSVYGVVRNCLYSILIHDVKNIGAPVDDPLQPIVPNESSTSDHLYLSFDIIDWHVIEERVPGVIQ